MVSLLLFHMAKMPVSRCVNVCSTSPMHTSCIRLVPSNRRLRPIKTSSRTRLVDNLRPASKKNGKLHVAPRNDRPDSGASVKSSVRRKSLYGDSRHIEKRPPPPIEGIHAAARGDGRTEPASDSILSPGTDHKRWAARAHSERVSRRAAEGKRHRKAEHVLRDEFCMSQKSEGFNHLPQDFTSPPLMHGLLLSLREFLSNDARPTPIQALSIKHVLSGQSSPGRWQQFLLAAETGSGKSIAYLLPLLQGLKELELRQTSGSQQNQHISSNFRRAINPRALILAPTHELSRQLSSFAKALSHNIKLRIFCASRANVPSIPSRSTTASKMALEFSGVSADANGRFEVRKEGKSRPVDVLVGTPNKLLEMCRGRGWNWEQRALERKQRATADKDNLDPLPESDDNSLPRKFWVDEPEMGLQDIEWVVVDEADVLFDHDFQESTRMLLSDISTARGSPVPFDRQVPHQSTDLDADNTSPSNPSIAYPFNFLLTSATIPASLASYLDCYHPSLIRLASPLLHHLPRTLKTEYAKWTGGNRNADIERRIRRVWAEDALAGAQSGHPPLLSKILVFCNKRSKVEDLSHFLKDRGINNVALTGTADDRKRGSNHHLDGFLQTKSTAGLITPAEQWKMSSSVDPKDIPHVMITTSLLSRGLDFSPLIKHVFMVDEPRNMVDFLHRAGRSGRAGEHGKVVVFGRAKGRGSGKSEEIKRKVQALAA